MRTDTPPIVRLEDYRPSDFLIDRVDLDIRLHPTADAGRRDPRRCGRIPQGGPAPPLVLDGDELELLGLALDGRALPPADYAATPQSLTLPNPPQRAVHPRDRDARSTRPPTPS